MKKQLKLDLEIKPGVIIYDVGEEVFRCNVCMAKCHRDAHVMFEGEQDTFIEKHATCILRGNEEYLRSRGFTDNGEKH